jgi:hypothetical protein
MSCSPKDCLSCKMIHAINNPVPYQEMLTQVPIRLPDGTQYNFIHPSVDGWSVTIFLAAQLGYKPEQCFCHDHYQFFLQAQRDSPEAQRQAALKK